jgi:hypothetical protein
MRSRGAGACIPRRHFHDRVSLSAYGDGESPVIMDSGRPERVGPGSERFDRAAGLGVEDPPPDELFGEIGG